MQNSIKAHGSFTPILYSDIRTIFGKSNVFKTEEHNKKCFQSGKNRVHGLKVSRFLTEQYIIPVKRCKPLGFATFQNNLSPEGSVGKSHY